MHLAIILSSLRGGGAERVMLSLAEGLANNGHQVDLVVSNATGPLLNSIPEGIHLVDLSSNRVLRSTIGLTNYLKCHKPDIAISALPHVNLVTVIAKLIACVNTKTILTEHNTLSQSIRNSRTLKGRYIYLGMKLLYRFSNSIVAVSRGVADDLATTINIDRSAISVIYNPVVTETLLLNAKKPVDHPWFLDKQLKVVLGVGRLTYAKNFSTLIRAFSRIDNIHNTRLVILGEGEDRTELERLIIELKLVDVVDLLGFVTNPYKFMYRSNIFVLSSRWEGLPTVLIEAMACGTEIISTDCPSGPREILENGAWGTLIPVGDEDALVESLNQSLRRQAPKLSPQSFSQYEFSYSVKQYDYLLECLLVK